MQSPTRSRVCKGGRNEVRHRLRKCRSFPEELYANFHIPEHKTHSVPPEPVAVYSASKYTSITEYIRITKEEDNFRRKGIQLLNIRGTNIKQPFHFERRNPT